MARRVGEQPKRRNGEHSSNPAAFNEVRQNGAPPLGTNGFLPPSLISVFAFQNDLLHNGDSRSLDDVL